MQPPSHDSGSDVLTETDTARTMLARVVRIVGTIPFPVNCRILLANCQVQAHQLVLARESLYFRDLFRANVASANTPEFEISLEGLVHTTGFLVALIVMYSRFQSLPISVNELLSELSDQDKQEAMSVCKQLGVVAFTELRESLLNNQTEQLTGPHCHKLPPERAVSPVTTDSKTRPRRNTHRFVSVGKRTASNKFIEVRRLATDEVNERRLSTKPVEEKSRLEEMRPMIKKMKFSLNNTKEPDGRSAEISNESLELDHQPTARHRSRTTSGPSQPASGCITSILAFTPSADGSATLQTQIETPYDEDGRCPSNEFAYMEKKILLENIKADKKPKPRRRSSKTKPPRPSSPAAVAASPITPTRPLASPVETDASERCDNIENGESFLQLMCGGGAEGVAPQQAPEILLDDWTKEFLIEEAR